MATFAPGQTIKTREPTITVDAGLALGVHRFQLVVLTDTGQTSAPAIAEVSVQRLVLDPLRPVLDATLTSPTITTLNTTLTDSTLVRPRAARTRKPRTPRSDT